MISLAASNITSPLGLTTEQNYAAVRRGESALKTLRNFKGIPVTLCAAKFSDESASAILEEGFTWFESLCLHSITEACSHTDIDLTSERVCLVLSTTKGNVEALEAEEGQEEGYSSPGAAAEKISAHLGMTTRPLAVCNACISGAAAIILAGRLIEAGRFDSVIVCGADVLSAFCAAGFTSFKALSPKPCRPFDLDRVGLNLGEGASTLILRRSEETRDGTWILHSGCITNDAYHVSAPDPSGKGLQRAIRGCAEDADPKLTATVCAHGTATLFNDQMESVAIAGAGFGDVPVSCFKPFYGHTLGAAGVLESVLAMRALDDGVILPVPGIEENGVSGRINDRTEERLSSGQSIVKTISGFGGCNAAMLFSKASAGEAAAEKSSWTTVPARQLRSLHLNAESFEMDGVLESLPGKGGQSLAEIYKERLADNPRFYKMDLFSRLVYVSCGLLLQDSCGKYSPECRSMILFNRSSSVLADRRHIESFTSESGFYPSPSIFLNTLPNVVMGELAVRYDIKGETDLIILPDRDDGMIDYLSRLSLRPGMLMLAGWVECGREDEFEADLKLLVSDCK